MTQDYKQTERPQKHGTYLSVRWNASFAKCCRCGYEWIPRKQDITTCAKCRSPYWDRPKNKEQYKQMRNFAVAIVQQDKYKGYRNSPDSEKCVDCGSQAKHWEHRNYARPLMVVPVCVSCNLKRGGSSNKKYKDAPKPIDI